MVSGKREPQNTQQGIMNVEVGQPSVAAKEVGTEADPHLTSKFLVRYSDYLATNEWLK
jgi:hypothetical protein